VNEPVESPAPVPIAELASRVADRFRASGASGSRIALESREEIVEDGGVSFVVRVLAAWVRAAAAAAKASAPAGGAAGAPPPARSPFLPPYDPDLLIGAVSPTHVCLLNKYNIVDRHLLIVTREYEEQESALAPGDLAAARTCLDAIDGVAFYNGGAAAGASQSHKHLQLVPFPLGPRGDRFPMDRAVAAALAEGRDRVPVLAARQRLAPLASRGDAHDVYRKLLESLDLDSGGGRTEPYNLLMTREWMLIVPRSKAAEGTIEVNALGLAGTLVVRGEEDLAVLRAMGPLELLRRVGVDG
jgi:ATP adenylyltransferase